MKISPEKLAAEAESTGFRPEMIEKVAHLLGLLNALRSHPLLRGKLVLKGGTALNIFIFDLPRLSVDIDLNYVGSEDLDGMLAERPRIERAVQAVFAREGFTVRRMPENHAGGKWLLRYENTSGSGSTLEVDINFMFRIPLWTLSVSDSYPVGTWRATGIPLLNIHELAAGKLAALMARRQARDLFDCHRILGMLDLNPLLLRIGFVVYGAMNRKDWRTVSVEDLDHDINELTRKLIPTLRINSTEEHKELSGYGARLVRECRERLSAVLPFTDPELRFLDLLLDQGEIDPALLTADESLQQRIRSQPLLEWKALNVKRFKGWS